MNLTVKELEERILRACKTIRALPDPERRYLNSGWRGDWLLPVAHSVEEAYGYRTGAEEGFEAKQERFRPSPADVSDCLTALAWARSVPRRTFKLIWWRSQGWSFRQMDLRLGRYEGGALRNYRDAMLQMWMAAQHAKKDYRKVAGNHENRASF